jgi:hypothetical protein
LGGWGIDGNDERSAELWCYAAAANWWYNPSMTAEHFQTAIRGFQRRNPFKSYVVELVSGDRVQVDHPEALVIRGGVGVFVSAEGAPTIFDHEGVSQIFAGSGESAAA